MPGSLNVGHGNIDASNKDRWRNIEGAPQDPKRGRDWWRTISLERDADNSRRDRWREEERENSNNLAPKRDRWKEGERETAGEQTAQAQNRRIVNDRWPESNPSTGREAGDQLRRPSSERWADTPNREANFDNRRDNKWSNRWGPPDEKEKEHRSKWGDGADKEGGDGGGYQQRHGANPHNVRDVDREREREREKDREREKEKDRELDTTRNDRAWRPSFASRGRGESLHLGTTPPKLAPGFGTGRGRGEPYGVGFTIGRGRGTAQGPGLLHGPLSSPIGSIFLGDKWDLGKDNPFRYPRVKLLDIHRKCGTESFIQYPDGFTEVAQLTQTDPFEPLAFLQPDVEEEV